MSKSAKSSNAPKSPLRLTKETVKSLRVTSGVMTGKVGTRDTIVAGKCTISE